MDWLKDQFSYLRKLKLRFWREAKELTEEWRTINLKGDIEMINHLLKIIPLSAWMEECKDCCAWMKSRIGEDLDTKHRPVENVVITLPSDLIRQADKARGDIPRSTYIRIAIEKYLRERDDGNTY
jgi:hypothetical protein